MRAIEYLKEIEWMIHNDAGGECPVCHRTQMEQHAQWCRLDRAIGVLAKPCECEPAIKSWIGVGYTFESCWFRLCDVLIKMAKKCPTCGQDIGRQDDGGQYGQM